MFASLSDFEVRIPAELQAPGERHWRALEISNHLPWFIATFQLFDGPDTYLHSMCFCWEMDLLVAIEDRSSTLRSLQMVLPPARNRPAWSLHPIIRLWTLSNTAERSRSPFLFEEIDGTCLCSLSGAKIAPDFHGRKVAAEITNAAHLAKVFDDSVK